MKRRTLLLTAGLVAAPSIVSAQAFPANPVRLIHGYDAGSNPDTIARHLSQPLTEIMGVQIVIEPKPGAAERVAATQVARMKPDGNVLYLMTGGQAVVSATDKSLSYDLLADFDFISIVTRFPFVFTVAPESRFRTMAAYLDEARREPGKLTYGSSGIGSNTHLMGEQLSTLAGIKLKHVPYRGSAPSLQDMLAGAIPSMFDPITTNVPHINAGKVRVLAISSEKRIDLYPNMPTFAEQGFPQMTTSTWVGVSGPKGMAPEVVSRLYDELQKAYKAPDVQERFKEVVLLPGDTPMSPAEYTKFVGDFAEIWKKVSKTAGISLELG